MPIPVVIIIVAVVALASAGGAMNWKKLVSNWKQRRVIALGQRGVGKTTLLNFLAKGELPETYEQTLAPNKLPKRRFALKDLELVTIKPSRDLPGGADARNQWKEHTKEADLLFYLVRRDRIDEGDKKNKDAIDRARSDVGWIRKCLEERKKQPHVFLVVNFCDKDPEFRKITQENAGNYQDKIGKLPIIAELSTAVAGKAKEVTIACGSMKEKKDIESLVYLIFKHLQP